VGWGKGITTTVNTAMGIMSKLWNERGWYGTRNAGVKCKLKFLIASTSFSRELHD
jgi:hypothetical protein